MINGFSRSACQLCGLSILFASMTLILGCGGSDGPRLVRVSGAVSFDGTPIEDGRIMFRMTSGDGRAYSNPITQGKYELECEVGPTIVEITASKPTPGKFDYSNNEKVAVGTMYIPSKYNSTTTLKKDITSGVNAIDFTLTTK